MNNHRRALVTLPLAAYASFSSTWALASEHKTQVQWAGVSLAGDFEQLPALMPTLHALIVQDDYFKKKFEQRVVQAVTESAIGHPGLQILVDKQMRQGDDAYALSLVLAGESITSYAVEDTTFVDFVVQALVLVGNVSKDPMRQRIVTSYPVQVRYQNAYPHGTRPSAEDSKTVVAGMLMGHTGRADLVSQWQKRLGQIRLRERDDWVAVAPLQIRPEAYQQGGFSKTQADRVAFKVSSVIEGNISRVADIPIVPSAFDGALTALTLSLADRGILAFRRPDPSRVIQVSVYALGSHTAEEAMTREKKFAVAYGGGFLVEYFSIDADQRKNLELGMRLQTVQSVTYLGASRDAHKASAPDMFSRLISGFADDVSNNLIPVNVNWLEKFRASTEPRSANELAKLVTSKLPAPRKSD